MNDDSGSKALERLFKISNNSVLIPWACLIFLPGPSTSHTEYFLAYAAVICSIYVYVAFAMKRHFPNLPNEKGGGFTSYAGVIRLFQAPRVVLAGWLHFLVLDLLLGLFILTDAQALGIHHLVMVPFLILTLMFAPAGLLAYLALRLLVG